MASPHVFAAKLDTLCAAVSRRDLDTALAHFADDCVFVDGATGEESDKAGLVGFLEETWASFPDYTPRVSAAHVDGDVVGGIYDLTGTLQTEEGSTGKQVRWMAAAFSTFDSESLLITRDVYYLDAALLERKVNEALSS